MQWEHDDSVRSAIRRAKIVKVDDSKTQQFVDLEGLKNEKPKKIYRPMDFGFFSHPPKDTEGVMVQMGSRSDRTLYFDGGHKDYRPKDRPEGSAGLFDQFGNLLQTDKDKWGITHKKKLTFALGKGYDAKDAGNYNGKPGSLTIEDGQGVTLLYAGAEVRIDNDGKITAKAKGRFAGGVDGGLWISVKGARVDLGVSGPDATATPAVMTDAGPSTKVFAEI